MTTMTDHPFDTDTAVERTGEHRYAVALTDRWSALGGTPNGGYMLAVALRALALEMPLPDPLAVSAHFLRPGAVGPGEVLTEVVRAGRRVATGEARLLQDGREAVRLLATFGDLEGAGGRTAMFNRPPDLPQHRRLPRCRMLQTECGESGCHSVRSRNSDARFSAHIVVAMRVRCVRRFRHPRHARHGPCSYARSTRATYASPSGSCQRPEYQLPTHPHMSPAGWAPSTILCPS